MAGNFFKGKVIQFGECQFFFLKAYFFQYCFFAWLKQGIQTAKYKHRQDHITIFTAHIDIAQTIVCNAPDKRNQLVMNGMIHIYSHLILRNYSGYCCLF